MAALLHSKPLVEMPVVSDTPWAGLIDAVGGLTSRALARKPS